MTRRLWPDEKADFGAMTPAEQRILLDFWAKKPNASFALAAKQVETRRNRHNANQQTSREK